MADIGKITTRQVVLRIGAFMLLMNIMSWLDRANLGFAAIEMNQEMGFDPKIFGLAVGIFSITHVLCQLPAAEAISRTGVRRALTIMMVLWGTFAALMGLIQNAEQLFVLRLLLGVAEAGVGPLTVIYASRWIPQKSIATFMAWVVISMPIGALLGAPISAFLISSTHDFAGLSGWRWMFLLEGIPAVILGIIGYFWLTERPEDARWLKEENRAWLVEQLRRDSGGGADGGHGAPIGGVGNLRWIVKDVNLWRFAATLFCLTSGVSGMLYWLPQVIRQLTAGVDGNTAVLLSGLPFAAAMVGMLTFAPLCDRTGERFLFVAGGLLLGAIGLVASFNVGSGVAPLVALMVGLFGIGGAMVTFWSAPTAHFRGRPGSGLALTSVNFLGFSSGLIVPVIIGQLHAATGGFDAVLWFLAALLLTGSIIIGTKRFERRALDAAPVASPGA